MNCPHCNSTYVDVKYVYEDMDKKESKCKCSACNKDFVDVEAKELVKDGVPLLELRDNVDGYSGHSNTIVRYYKTPAGLVIMQKKKDVDNGKIYFHNITTRPHIKAKKGYGNKTYLDYNSFRTPNDSKGTLFSVGHIELYGELKEAAKSNEAMKVITSNDYLRLGHENGQATTDAARWINEQLSKYQVVPNTTTTNTSNASNSTPSGGCYIATAVYGSYDCPEVWTLRRYRDNKLASSFLGRAFIRTYYAISPTLVRVFGKTKWFKNLFKKPLDNMVKRLNSEGYADTPYSDKNYI